MDFMQVALRLQMDRFLGPQVMKKKPVTCHPVAKRFFLFILRLLDRLTEKQYVFHQLFTSGFPQMHSLYLHSHLMI